MQVPESNANRIQARFALELDIARGYTAHDFSLIRVTPRDTHMVARNLAEGKNESKPTQTTAVASE